MKTIICDDCINEAEKTKELLIRNKLVDGEEISIFLPDNLREEIGNKTLQCDIAIMDIEFAEKPYNGINLSAEINKLLPSSQIIYLTNILEFASEVYETRHCYFVLKADMEMILPRAVEKAQNIIMKKKDSGVMEIVSNGRRVLIPQSDIVYVERAQRKLIIHTQKDSYSSYGSLRKFLSQANSLFVRCHEAYIVNLDFVRVVRKDEVELAGGENIPVGISFEKMLRTKYMEYWSERI